MSLLYLDEFGKAFVPKKIRPNLSKYLAKAGIEEVPYKFFGVLFWITAVITYFVYVPFLYPILKGNSPIIFFIATFFGWFLIQVIVALVLVVSIYFYLNIKIYQRTKILEDFLPDYLTLVSTNLKGGMNFEKSLWAAIKPEFGILAHEVGLVSKRVATGNDVGDALQELADKYDSPTLRRSIDLIKGEIASGGSITGVIDSLVTNLKKSKAIKAEMVAATLTYMIFMAVIVVVIMPALFALSKQLLTILLKFGARIGQGLASAKTSMFTFQVANIDPYHFQIFSIVAISVIAIFTSLIISTIEKGDIRGGLKYIPMFSVGAVVMYFIFSIIMEGLMGGLVA